MEWSRTGRVALWAVLSACAVVVGGPSAGESVYSNALYALLAFGVIAATILKDVAVHAGKSPKEAARIKAVALCAANLSAVLLWMAKKLSTDAVLVGGTPPGQPLEMSWTDIQTVDKSYRKLNGTQSFVSTVPGGSVSKLAAEAVAATTTGAPAVGVLFRSSTSSSGDAAALPMVGPAVGRTTTGVVSSRDDQSTQRKPSLTLLLAALLVANAILPIAAFFPRGQESFADPQAAPAESASFLKHSVMAAVALVGISAMRAHKRLLAVTPFWDGETMALLLWVLVLSPFLS
jgi:hypothetical protein